MVGFDWSQICSRISNSKNVIDSMVNLTWVMISFYDSKSIWGFLCYVTQRRTSINFNDFKTSGNTSSFEMTLRTSMTLSFYCEQLQQQPHRGHQRPQEVHVKLQLLKIVTNCFLRRDQNAIAFNQQTFSFIVLHFGLNNQSPAKLPWSTFKIVKEPTLWCHPNTKKCSWNLPIHGLKTKSEKANQVSCGVDTKKIQPIINSTRVMPIREDFRTKELANKLSFFHWSSESVSTFESNLVFWWFHTEPPSPKDLSACSMSVKNFKSSSIEVILRSKQNELMPRFVTTVAEYVPSLTDNPK